ncbi:MAG: 1,4-alpha-glucan branching protein GlgB [Lachnospiraceae bacterium]|nr:1,4-alpha-glucan branching protein GlgB [Robinsoniella sp.]MDY3766681.1 1,4-alpha-glucan branching protein GlgB [Lachnospiraceae bacterium]
MDKKLYDLMDWAAIEAVVYSEEDQPHSLLGAHETENGILIQTFIPSAVEVSVKIAGVKEEYPMEVADEAGFFAVLLPRKTIPEYSYKITYDNGETGEMMDPYVFEPQISEEMTKKFNAGICYDIYEKLGAHPMTVNGVDGVYFAVWAPNAMRVSVVGNFNLWDGRRMPMRRLWDSGIFELFIPGLAAGELYKYEIKAKGGLTYLKADPYANAAELRPNTASIVADLRHFDWTDKEWIAEREKRDTKTEPMFIYELHLGSWKKPEDGRIFYNYRELAPMIAEYVKEMGYTHIELMPVMEHPFDGSWGYQVTGYYAPTSRYGTPEDFMYFMNYMHEQKIGVIIDWVPAHFPRDTFGLSNFDGTCLYEHYDPKQGSHPHWGTLIYNYGRPEVKNFLIANALFWAEKYHVDGIRMDAVASMLYLDYGKNDGEWVANMYGGNENLEAVEFFKHLNSIFHQKEKGVMMIAEESTAWPKVTGDVREDGLGFDYKWNMGWMNDFIGYMSLDPIYRASRHGELTFSMIYAYSEDFILTLSHDEVVHGKASMIGKMPGDRKQKFANLRAAYGFMMTHPGKKLLFMGQDFAQFSEWNEEKGLEWDLLEYDEHRQMQQYLKDFNKFYKEQPALYKLDYDPKGFEWINVILANENMLVFTRNTEKKEETLLVVCNFSPLVHEKRKIGVPYPGKYKEIFNSDRAEYGGDGNVNPRLKQSKKEECDDRPDSITIKVPPMGIAIFSYTKGTQKPTTNRTAKEKEPVEKVTIRKPRKKKSLKEELEQKIAEEESKTTPSEIELAEKTETSKKKKTSGTKTKTKKKES